MREREGDKEGGEEIKVGQPVMVPGRAGREVKWRRNEREKGRKVNGKRRKEGNWGNDRRERNKNKEKNVKKGDKETKIRKRL